MLTLLGGNRRLHAPGTQRNGKIEFEMPEVVPLTPQAVYRFFNSHVIVPMVAAMRHYEEALPPQMLQKMADSWTVFTHNKQEMGMQFYQILFEKYPFVLPIFGRADMDYLSLHLFQSLEFLMRCLSSDSTDDMMRELRFLGLVHRSAGVPSCAYPAISDCSKKQSSIWIRLQLSRNGNRRIGRGVG